MQLGPSGRYTIDNMFQSSSGQKAGCNHPAIPADPLSPGFNPHPAFWPDATSVPRPRPRMVRCFNPHPARRPDATSGSVPVISAMSLFQSSSGLLAGCNLGGVDIKHQRLVVSILIRPEGRMQLVATAVGNKESCFNPHPARRPDATRDWPGRRVTSIRFQSSSGQKAGCNGQPVKLLGRLLHCFNPHPARRPDATCLLPAGGTRYMFQSSSGQKAGCNRVTTYGLLPSGWMFQSSSGQKAGCNESKSTAPTHNRKFQSSSGQKAGCNFMLWAASSPAIDMFQSSSGQKAGCNQDGGVM